MTRDYGNEIRQTTYTLSNHTHRIEISADLARDQVIGVQNGSVVALCASPEAVHDMQELKGEARQGRPVGLMMSFRDLVAQEIIDYDRIAPELRSLIDPEKAMQNGVHTLDRVFGALGFIRLPAKKQALAHTSIPPNAISYEDEENREGAVVQNYSPIGHNFVADLLARSGIQNAVITSMNESGKPEITEAEAAQKFANTNGIKFIADPHFNQPQRGSYPITAIHDRIELVREGNLPAWVTGRLFAPHDVIVKTSALVPSMGRMPLELAVDSPLLILEGQLARNALIRQFDWNQPTGPLHATGGEAPFVQRYEMGEAYYSPH